MAKLVDQVLRADDCTKMVMSFWFKIPALPPPTGTALPNYLLLEFGEYEQISARRWYPLAFRMVQTVKYPDVVPWHNSPGEEPTVGWFDQHANLPEAEPSFVYGWLPGTPLGGPEGDRMVGQILHEGDPIPESNIDEIDVRWAEVTYNTGGFPGYYEFWGEQHGYVPPPPSPINGPPGFGAPFGDISADLWAMEFTPFNNTYYYWDPPSSVAIVGTAADKLQVQVRIAGTVSGPYDANQSSWLGAIQLGTTPFNRSIEWPGYTIIPSLTVAAPHLTPFAGDGESNPPLGTEQRPYVTVDEWHHLLCCVDLKGDSMVEKVPVESYTPGAAPGRTSAFYRPCVMWVLLDGVKYGGDPWPADFPPINQPPSGPRPEWNRQGIESDSFTFAPYHEFPEQNYTFPPTAAMMPLQDTSCFSRNGIQVKNTPFSIPYHQKWTRISSEQYSNDEMYSLDRPFHFGWQGGDPEKDVIVLVRAVTRAGGGDYTEPVPASQLDAPRADDDNTPPHTEDIKRYYSDLQVWFGKYIDPTDYENLKLFLDITRDDEGNLVGNIPEINEEELADYVTEIANDPTVKILSKAAAPKNLGQPDVYLAGGASSFIHNRGKETTAGPVGGDDMVKTGTINDTPGPVDIPIPESAVKPIGL